MIGLRFSRWRGCRCGAVGDNHVRRYAIVAPLLQGGDKIGAWTMGSIPLGIAIDHLTEPVGTGAALTMANAGRPEEPDEGRWKL